MPNYTTGFPCAPRHEQRQLYLYVLGCFMRSNTGNFDREYN
jgi:hypothetical protein